MDKLIPAKIIREHALDAHGCFKQRVANGDIRILTLSAVLSLLNAPAPTPGFECYARQKREGYVSQFYALDNIETYREYLAGNASLWQPPAVPSVKLTHTQNTAFLSLPHKLYSTPAGRVVRRDAYQMGAPCTFARAPQASDQRVVRLAISSAVNSNVNAIDIARYASGILAIIKAIEKLGIAYEIAIYEVTHRSWTNDSKTAQVFWLKRANDCISKHRLNAMIVCPDTLRRAIFEIDERDGIDTSNSSCIGLNRATLGQQKWFNETFDLCLPAMVEIGYDPQKLIEWTVTNWKLGAQNA